MARPGTRPGSSRRSGVSHALTALSRINAETYERAGRETGIDTGFRRRGALTIARTEARMNEIRYGSRWRAIGRAVELVDRERIARAVAGRGRDHLVGGGFFPTDGTVNPGSAALALARRAVDRGVRYVPGTDGDRVPPGAGRPPRDRHRRRGGGGLDAESSSWPPACGRPNWPGWPAPASRSTRPSTCGS